MKQKLQIVCVKCGLSVGLKDAPNSFHRNSASVNGFRSWCKQCLIDHADEIRCIQCGFSCSPEEAPKFFHRQWNRSHGFNDRCKDCKNGNQRCKYEPLPVRVPANREFEMGDCRVLWKASGRCDGFDDCKHYDACLDQAAMMNWPGWGCIHLKKEKMHGIA